MGVDQMEGGEVMRVGRSRLDKPDPVVTWNENLLKDSGNKAIFQGFIEKFRGQITNGNMGSSLENGNNSINSIELDKKNVGDIQDLIDKLMKDRGIKITFTAPAGKTITLPSIGRDGYLGTKTFRGMKALIDYSAPAPTPAPAPTHIMDISLTGVRKLDLSVVKQGIGEYPIRQENEVNNYTGKGTLIYKNASGQETIIAGSFNNGKVDGKAMVWNDGHGKGVITYANGTITNMDYEYQNGDTYTGGIKDNKYDGKGKYVYADGKVIEGEWRAGDFLPNQAQLLTEINTAIRTGILEVGTTYGGPNDRGSAERGQLWKLLSRYPGLDNLGFVGEMNQDNPQRNIRLDGNSIILTGSTDNAEYRIDIGSGKISKKTRQDIQAEYEQGVSKRINDMNAEDFLMSRYFGISGKDILLDTIGKYDKIQTTVKSYIAKSIPGGQDGSNIIITKVEKIPNVVEGIHIFYSAGDGKTGVIERIPQGIRVKHDYTPVPHEPIRL